MQLIAGQTVAEILRAVQPDNFLRRDAIVTLGGIEIPREYWSRVRPKPGHQLDVIITLQGGGGGKNPLRTILSIALLAAGAYFGPMLGAALLPQAGLAAQTAIGGALISFAGNLALNALVPPQQPKIGRLSGTSNETSQYYAIEDARNRERPWEKIPRVYGTHRLYADKGAKFYTETDGDDQYLRGLIVWGVGPLSLSDFKIGETPIEEYEGLEIEHRFGYEDDAPLTLFTNDVHEESLAVALTQEAGWVVRTTEPDIDEIGVEVALPNGLVEFNDRGDRVERFLQFEVEYAVAGSGAWNSSSAGIAVAQKELTLNPPPRRTRSRYPYTAIPTAHAARIVINRQTGEIGVIYGSGSAWAANPVPPTPVWADSLATVQIDADAEGAITNVAITDTRTADAPARGDADDFLVTAAGGLTVSVAAGRLYPTGIEIREKRPSEIRRSLHFPVPRGQYDVRVRRISADTSDDKIFDKSFWSRLRSIRNDEPVKYPKPLAKTAFRIKASGQLNSFVDTINCIGTSILPVYDEENDDWDTEAPTSNPASVARDILQGPATKWPLPDEEIHPGSLRDFYIGCVERGYGYNSVIDYATSVGALLDEVCAAGRAFHHRPDGRVTFAMERPQTTPVQHFTPANTWEFSGEIVYPDLPHGLRVRFANADKGWRTDMRTVFIDGYDETNATEYEDADMPGITDAQLIWEHGRYNLAVAYNRREKFYFWTDFESLQSVRGDLCLFSHDVPRFGLASGRLTAIDDNGTHVTAVTLDTPVTMQAGADYVVRVVLPDGYSLLAPVVTDTDAGGVRTLALKVPVPLADGPHAGALFMFGQSEQECVKVLVKSIERGSGTNMRVACIPYAPAVYEADQGEAPAWSSSLQAVPDAGRPAITQVRSDHTVLLRDPDGSVTNRMLVGFNRPGTLFAGLREVQGRFRERGSGGVWTYVTAAADQGEIGLMPVKDGEAYEYQLRWVVPDDRPNDWTALAYHTVIGKGEPPGTVQGFTGQQNGPVVLFRWRQRPETDIKGYDIRYIEAATPLAGETLWRNMNPLKAVERGDELTSAGVSPGDWLFGIKAIDTSGNESVHAAFFTLSVANALDIIYARRSDPRWAGVKTDCFVHDVSGQLAPDDRAPASGDNFDVFDNYRLDPVESYAYESGAFDIGFNYPDIRVWADREIRYAPDADGGARSSLEIATAADGGAFGPWQNWAIGTTTAQRVKHRLTVDTSEALASLVQFRPVVDVEEREQTGAAVSGIDGDILIAFDRPFVHEPLVEITVNSATPAFPAWHSAGADGILLSVYDSAGDRIERSVTYRITGA